MSDNKITIYSGGYAGAKITDLEFIPGTDENGLIYKYTVVGKLHLENPYYKRLAHKGLLYIGVLHKARWIRRNAHHYMDKHHHKYECTERPYGEHLKKWTILSRYNNQYKIYKEGKSNTFNFEIMVFKRNFFGESFPMYDGKCAWKSFISECMWSQREINDRYEGGSANLATKFFVDTKMSLFFKNEYSYRRCITTIGDVNRLYFDITEDDKKLIHF